MREEDEPFPGIGQLDELIGRMPHGDPHAPVADEAMELEQDLFAASQRLAGQGRLADAAAGLAACVRCLSTLAGLGRGGLELALAWRCNALGNVLAEIGLSLEAEQAFRGALTIEQQLVDAGWREREPHLAASLANWGSILHALGRPAEAEQAHRRATTFLRRLVEGELPGLEPVLAASWANLGRALTDLGRSADAEQAFAEALGLFQQLVDTGRPELEPELATCWSSLGLARSRAGRHGEAEQAHRRSLVLRQRLAGAGLAGLEPFLALGWGNLALTLGELGRWAEAEQAHRQATSILVRLVDEGSAGLEPALAASWSYLGTALDRLGRPDEAEQPFRCSLSLRRQLVDAGHGELKPELAASCRALAAHLEVQERPGEAEELLRCGKELLEQRVLERDFLLEPELLDHWLQLVRLQLRLGRFAALEDELHRAAQLLPHLPLLHAAGRAIYRELLAQPDAQLELGGLPREEVLEGAVDFAALLAPFHAGSWPGDLARAEQLADELGRPEQGQALLAAGARLFGAGDPRYHLALAGFCRDRQRPDEAWAAAQQAVAACTDLLQRKEQDPPQLDEDAHASLLWLLLAALRLAARSGLGEEVEPAYRQQRRGELVDQLGRHEQLWHGQGDALRIARSGLLGELEQEGGVRGQPGEELWPLRRGFGPMLGDRWSEVRGELGRTAAQARAGRLEQREAVRLLADLLLRLAETREVRQCLVHWRGSLLAQLHVDLVSECPELRPLPCVLGLVRLLPGEPALPRLAIAGLGGVVEAALLRRLFGPYLTALAQGQAEPIAASGLIAGQLQGEEPSGEPTPSLRVLVEPWARLVSRPAWVDDAESGALARWLVRRYAAAELLREPRLACLDRVAELYGRALDLQAPEPGAGELEELLGLVWSGEPALLPRLYRARFGEGCSRCHRA